MPIHLEIYHPDRIVVAVARGEITIAQFGGLVRELAQSGAMHYRKIFDVTDAKSASVGMKNKLDGAVGSCQGPGQGSAPLILLWEVRPKLVGKQRKPLPQHPKLG